MAVEQAYTTPGPLPQPADIVVPTGGSHEAAEALLHARAINHPLIFRLAAYATHGQGPLHAGEFRFPAHASLAGVLDVLRHAAPVQHHVTIPEGLTGAQIAKILNAAATATGQVAPPVDGTVLPQTYDYLWGTPRREILQRATAAMQTELSTAWAGRAPGLPLATPEEALTLASIVQQETPLPAELPKVAGVYENRLRQGMKLQADPTVIYAASNGAQSGGKEITKADLELASPYNTYMNAGLPPGPICAPGAAALEAVLHPEVSDNMYFVATGHGGHVFSHFFKDQLRNIQQFWNTHK
jgi:UPF0755 protein